jgi:hypothetical protein
MKFKSTLTPLLLGLSLIGGVANASFISVGPASPLSNLAGSNGPVTVTYTGATATQILFSNKANSDVGNQSAANVASVMNAAFGLPAGTIHTSTVSQVDNLGGGSSATISSVNPFDYLAVHAGQHELFFYWATAITSLDITTSGKAIGLSNYRAFNAVPVPTAVWLFGSGLLGLIGAARKKSKAAI